MTTLEAHACLAGRRDRSIFDFDVEAQTPDGSADAWPAYCAALALLSGGLHDAADDDELDDAIRHGLSLLNCEVLQPADVNSATADVILEIYRQYQHQHALCY